MSTVKPLKSLKTSQPKKKSKLWIVIGWGAGLLALCCVGVFALALADVGLRQIGLLPTYTPTLTRTPAPPPTATGTPAPVPAATSEPTNTAPAMPPSPAPTFTPDLVAKIEADVDLLANQMADLRIALKDGDFNAKKAAIVAPVEAVIVTANRLKEESAGLSPETRRRVTETALDCRNAATTIKQGFDEVKPDLITLASTMFDNCDIGLGLTTVKLALE